MVWPTSFCNLSVLRGCHTGDDRYRICHDTGRKRDFYRLLDQFDNFTSKVNVDADNVSKLILYEDLMLQRYRSNLAVIDVEAHYLDLMTKA